MIGCQHCGSGSWLFKGLLRFRPNQPLTSATNKGLVLAIDRCKATRLLPAPSCHLPYQLAALFGRSTDRIESLPLRTMRVLKMFLVKRAMF
jgi:hypothetical protein